MDLSIDRTLFVLAAQPPPSRPSFLETCLGQAPEEEFGQFRSDHSRLLYMCNDNRRLLHDEEYRNTVARQVIRGTQEKFPHIETLAVLVHKTRPDFVYGMLGLADELKQLSLYDLRIVVLTDTSNGLSPRSAVLDCLHQVQRESPPNRMPCLVRQFDESRVIDFKDVLLDPATN